MPLTDRPGLSQRRAPSCASTPSVTAQPASACAACRFTFAGVGDQKEALRYDISDTLHEDALPPCRSFQPRPDAQSSCAASSLRPSATAIARYTLYAPFHHERSAVTVFDEVNVPPNVGSMWSETLGHLPRVFTASANIEQRLGRAPTASEIRMGATDRS
jgi:hypothetical protein